MGILTWLFGKREGRASGRQDKKGIRPVLDPARCPEFADQPAACIQSHAKAFHVDVVGSARFQKDLSRIASLYTAKGAQLRVVAILRIEPEHQKDGNAVGVFVSGSKVGSLPHDQAERVTEQMEAHGIHEAQCMAVIAGSWHDGSEERGRFCVKLRMPREGIIDFGKRCPPRPRRTADILEYPSHRKAPLLPAHSGALKGQRVALLGASAEGVVARELAAQGAEIQPGVCTSTTLLVYISDSGLTPQIKAAPAFKMASDLKAQGSALQILSLGDAREMIARKGKRA